MDIKFTPWRMEYILSPKKEGAECVFCRAFSEPPSIDNLVAYRDEDVAVMLNKYPYNNGHILVIPRPHVNSLTCLDDKTRDSMMRVLTFSEKLLREVYNPMGFNIGLNLGEAAGAGIKEHLHFHMVPRWNGDTNFVTLFGELRVIPEDLRTIFERLRAEYPEHIG